MPVFCAQCGATMEPDARFCEECGTQAEEKTASDIPRSSGQLLHAAAPTRRAQEAQPSQPYPPADMEAQQRVVIAGETKSSGVGIVLSFLWTGMGQLYAGAIARGLVMMAATPIVWMIGFGGFGALITGRVFGFLMAVAPVIWWIWGMVDAKNLCEAFNRRVAQSL